MVNEDISALKFYTSVAHHNAMKMTLYWLLCEIKVKATRKTLYKGSLAILIEINFALASFSDLVTEFHIGFTSLQIA